MEVAKGLRNINILRDGSSRVMFVFPSRRSMKGLGLGLRKIVVESFCMTGSRGGLDSLVERVFFFQNSHLYTFNTIHDRKQ
jgi:hypothetical protein